MNHDCTTQTVGNRGQIEAAAGAPSPNPGRLVAPTIGDKDACVESLMQLQDWDEDPANRWPETSGAVIQKEEVGTPPMRVKAAPSNLKQGLPTDCRK